MSPNTPVWPPKSCDIDSETGAATEAFARDYGFVGARDILANGGLLALPTETVYGLAADATNAKAVAKIFAAKDRPSFNPLISHVPSLEAAQRHGIFNDDALTLARQFWPGPLTLVVPKRADSPIADLTSAGLDTVALRVPDAPLMRALSHALDKPLAAPSANRSGRVSPTTAAHVREELAGRLDLIADLGPCKVGVESSVVLCSDRVPATLLRPGGLSTDVLEQALGRPLLRAGTDDNTPRSPGMLTSHYAPSVPVRLNAEDVKDGEALLAFGPDMPTGADGAVKVLNLSPKGDSFEAAQHLFAFLRELDMEGVQTIAVAPISNDGLGEAINDRLQRAAR
ncbi:L-threonylcarbamoyladenylate synthase [Cohaesibacter celericrescens]|uniref:Threonylcarbamoyl-AMP synthase n=1 Tax=Cohaesibacter celericrescens TaxID=2067669 RepID=A0A2N5XVD2_9HYPH|nr:L-threonylcarbamoyladenylate synthase [Cohaesibacter celericrescens]PLW78427.1 threonylcarbamoyl-AMP synthase [Cohaesibacter celericrescens]